MRRTLTALLAAAALSAPAFAQAEDGLVIESEQAEFRIELLTEGLDYPWDMEFLPGGAILVSERSGQLRVFEDGALRDAAVDGLPDIHVERQGGLLGLALHPDFEENRWVYFSYAAGSSASNATTLGRGRLNADMTALTDVEELFQVNFRKQRGFHFGGRISFLEDGTLLLALGDGGGYRDEAQNRENHIGTIVRLDDDGSLPFDNPWLTTDGVRPEIWSWGHRNIQGMAINPETGSVWAHEHGARGGDEINVIEPTLNYGWPAVTYGINYDGSVISDETHGEGFTQPIWYWVPSIAPSGMDFYTGDAFPRWNGDVFVGALAGAMLVRYEVEGDRVISEEEMLTELGVRIRAVRTGPDGALYILTDDENGQMFRLVPAG